MITISELVILGTAVPEQTKNNGKTVCAIGHSEELGLIRVYPCRYSDELSRWNVVKDVKLHKNPKDSRLESYKPDSDNEWRVLRKITCGNDKTDIINKYLYGCVNDIRDGMLSIGIVKIENNISMITSNNPNYTSQPDMAYFSNNDQWLRTQKDYPEIPRLIFRCGETCHAKDSHKPSVVEWGAFEWIRKNETNIQQLSNNWKLNDNNYEKYLLMGNIYKHRRSFIVISVIPIKIKTDKTIHMFSMQRYLDGHISTNNVQGSFYKAVKEAISKISRQPERKCSVC